MIQTNIDGGTENKNDEELELPEIITLDFAAKI